METKANYVLVGAFTIFLFVAALAFAWWIRSGGGGNDTVRLDVVIEGSVTGLEVGSPVKFNGINVGKVDGLRFDPTNPNVVIAVTSVSQSVPLTASTRAVLGFTGLTGIAHIEFEGGSAGEPSVFSLASERGVTPAIEADPAAINDILATAQDVFRRVDAVMGEVEVFVKDVREPLTRTLANTEAFSAALAQNSTKIDSFLQGIGDVGASLAEVSDDLEVLLASVDGLVQAVEPGQITQIVSNVEAFTGELTTVSADVSKIVATADATLAQFEGAGEGLEDVLEGLNGIIASVDEVIDEIPDDAVSASLTNVTEASQAVRDAAGDIATFTETLGARQGDIDQTISNVAQMAERLNAASVRVDGVLAKVDGFLGEGDAGTLVQDATETLRSFRDVADNLNTQLDGLFGEDGAGNVMADISATLASFRQLAANMNTRLDGITANLDRFTGRGLRDVEALVSDTRRSINRIEQAITNLERDPQRLIFGGEGTVKRFDGRQRR